MLKFRKNSSRSYRVLYDVAYYQHDLLYAYTKRSLFLYSYLYRRIVDLK